MAAKVSCALCPFAMVLTVGLVQADEPRPPKVTIVQPVVRMIADNATSTGRLDATSKVSLRPRVTGILAKALVKDGSEVRQGDVLFEIDSTSYRAELDKAQTAVDVAKTHLITAEANVKQAASLLQKGPISQAEYDKAVNERTEAKAVLRQAQANRDAAQRNLEMTRIMAPISGQIGRLLVSPGNLVKADETLLAEIASPNPIYVYFEVDERTMLQLRQKQLAGQFTLEKMPVSVGLLTENGFPHSGTADFIENRVNPQTGTVRFRAVLPNTNKLMLPGMSVRVRYPTSAPHEAILIPQAAVRREGGKAFVYVENDKNTFEKRLVEIGQQYDDQAAVTSGLKVEDRVAIGDLDGTSIRPGASSNKAPDKGPEPLAGKSNSTLEPARTGREIEVRIRYPGADAQVISESVRAPIEQQISDAEGIRSIRSRCANDGNYTLSVSFHSDTDTKTAREVVQNRLSLAMPLLPQAVQQAGAALQNVTSGPLLIVNLVSPDARYDGTYLTNYARLNIKDELARVSGVQAVRLTGGIEMGVRILLDPDRLSARALNAIEIKQQIEMQKSAEVFDVEKLLDFVVKNDGDGRFVCLKDVAVVERIAVGSAQFATLDDKPVVSLAVFASSKSSPRQLREALKTKLAEIRARFPSGLDLDLSFDFTANLGGGENRQSPEYLLVDLDFPDQSSTERTAASLSRASKLLRQVNGVEHTLALASNPFEFVSERPCVLLRLASAPRRESNRQEIISSIRSQEKSLPETVMRVRDLGSGSRPSHAGYPIDFALCGPDQVQLNRWAEELVRKLGAGKKIVDANKDRDSRSQRRMIVDVDRNKCAEAGLTPAEVSDTIQLFLRPVPLSGVHSITGLGQVTIQFGAEISPRLEDLRNIKIRSNAGNIIPVAAIAAVHAETGPAALNYLNGQLMIEITANPEPSAKLAEARRQCESLAEETRRQLQLPATFRLVWLNQPGSEK
jgi:RND family efflux transporter MFP subunit